MTNNTINNVPRELLERARAAVASTNTSNWSSDLLRDIHAILSAPSPAGVDADHVEDVRAMVADPSPAGVDGLEVVGYVSQDDIKWQGDCTLRLKPYDDYVIPLCRLSDATAIIDGLRGEVADLRSMLATVSQAGLRVRTERDQQAQRIGELEGLLREVHWWIDESARVYRHNSTSVMLYRIDAALSAGKEGE